MPDRDEEFKEAFSELANALQTAAPLATHQRRMRPERGEKGGA